MVKFKVGDLVRCVKPDPERCLRVGDNYVVESVFAIYDDVFVAVEGGHPFWAARFEPAGTTRTVAPENRSRVDAGPRTL
jgi:hypothetical protein